MGLMEILGHILHHLGTHGAGALGLKIAQHLRPLFEDVSNSVRLRGFYPSPPIRADVLLPRPLCQGLWVKSAGIGGRREPRAREGRFPEGSGLLRRYHSQTSCPLHPEDVGGMVAGVWETQGGSLALERPLEVVTGDISGQPGAR